MSRLISSKQNRGGGIPNIRFNKIAVYLSAATILIIGILVLEYVFGKAGKTDMAVIGLDYHAVIKAYGQPDFVAELPLTRESRLGIFPRSLISIADSLDVGDTVTVKIASWDGLLWDKQAFFRPREERWICVHQMEWKIDVRF